MTVPTPYPFLDDPGVQQLFTAFPKGSLRVVGGAVRNAILKEPVADIDLATTLEPDAVVDALASASIKYVPTGLAHGTVTAVIDGKPYEITSLRGDVDTDGRRATVAYTTDWSEDASRRDFTMNALYVDADGVLHDPTGQGRGIEGAHRGTLRPPG